MTEQQMMASGIPASFLFSKSLTADFFKNFVIQKLATIAVYTVLPKTGWQ